MSRSTTAGRTAAVVATSAALAASGLLSTAAQASRPLPAATSVRIVGHKLHMPSTVRAGLHTFRVKGKQVSLQIVKVHGRYSPQQFVKDYTKGGQQGDVKSIRSLERHVTFVGGGQASAGKPGTVTVRLPRGTFWAFDSQPDKIKASNLFVGHAVGPARAGTPTGTTTITAVDPNRWSTADPQTIPTSGTLLFHNASSDNHFVVVIKLAAGKTITDFGNWVTAVNAGKATFNDAPIDNAAPGYFNAILEHGRSEASNYSLPAGNYVVACFYPDADMGGMPHVLMGMYQGVTVK